MTPPDSPRRKTRTIKARIVPPVRLPRRQKPQSAPERPERQRDKRRSNTAPRHQTEPQPQSPLADSASAITPPLDPQPFHQLLRDNPARAAASLAALRPAQLALQAQAHAALVGADPVSVSAEWGRLISRYRPPPPVVGGEVEHGTVYEPEPLALADPAEATLLIAALTPAQRVQQAVAQAAWLNSFGYPITAHEILAMWEGWEEGRHAA